MGDVEYVVNSPHPESLVARHRALLERVAKLERALEKIAEGNWNVGEPYDRHVRQFARDSLSD
jgi:DNA-binding response OmpR family regulator